MSSSSPAVSCAFNSVAVCPVFGQGRLSSALLPKPLAWATVRAPRDAVQLLEAVEQLAVPELSRRLASCWAACHDGGASRSRRGQEALCMVTICMVPGDLMEGEMVLRRECSQQCCDPTLNPEP